MRKTSTSYEVPHRPAVIRVANGLLGRLQRLSVARADLTFESLVREAEKRSRERWTVDMEDVEAPLEMLLRSIEEEAQLHPIGRFITRERIVSTLANRMRVEAASRALPTDLAALAPIVIVGLPRTGTTLLHRLLAADPRVRSLTSWEALTPARLRNDPEDQARMRIAERSESGLAFLAPDFFAVHPIDAHAPEEDVLLLDLSFRSTVAESTLRVPSFSRWLEGQDQLPAYRILEKSLRVMQHERPQARKTHWVLKTPHHLEWLDVLLEVFPKATFVWTHRDLNEVVPSFCSMLSHARGVFSDAVDAQEIGRSWLRKGARMMERGLEVRAKRKDRFVDIQYADLVANPVAQVKRIHAHAGLVWDREAEDCVKDKLKVQRKDKFGEHIYRLADFGLREADLEAAFGTHARQG
jgi:hypothetical protein